MKSFRVRESDATFLLIEFETAEGLRGQIKEPFGQVVDTRRLYQRLLDAGAELPTTYDPKILQRLTSGRMPSVRWAARFGWHGSVFVLDRERVFGSKKIRVDRGLKSPFRKASGADKEGWADSVGRLAQNSSYAMFAICHHLAAPLFRFADLEEGAIFHFGGDSTGGKTTAITAGASVSGYVKHLPTWNVTLRGVAETAATMTGLQLILADSDIIPAQERPKLMHNVAHFLTGGTTKTIADMAKGQLPDLEFDAWGISSGRSTIAEMCASSGFHREDSDLVRLIDIPVPTRDEGGVFDKASFNRHSIAGHMTKGAKKFAGAPMEEWLKYLVTERKSLRKRVDKLMRWFLRRLKEETQDVLHRRICRKFSLVFAAGVLAVGAGLLKWTKQSVFEAVSTLFRKSVQGAAFPETRILRVGAQRLLSGLEKIDVKTVAAEERLFVENPEELKAFRVVEEGLARIGIRKRVVEIELGAYFGQFVKQAVTTGIVYRGKKGITMQKKVYLTTGRCKNYRFLVFDERGLRNHSIRIG